MRSHLQDSHSREASLSQPTAHDIQTDISQPELATLVLIFNRTLILQHASLHRLTNSNDQTRHKTTLAQLVNNLQNLLKTNKCY